MFALHAEQTEEINRLVAELREGSYRPIEVKRVHMALPNEWFKELGLFNMEEIATNMLHQYYEVVLNKV